MFIIFGATGDLTKRKLIPAIYKLIKDEKLKKFTLIGVARSDIKIGSILDEARKLIGKVDEEIWNKLVNTAYYVSVDLNGSSNYKKLKEFLEDIESKNKLSRNRLFYLATLPEHFNIITHNLAKSGICKKEKDEWPRVVYEKPFGYNLKSAQKINNCINRIFDEEQIYRIDHYLGKELVGNITLVRFTNSIFEPLWNKKYVENVQIIMKENRGIENRGGYYDKYGALKDVVQNHALQLLALVAMETPTRLGGNFIRDEKAKVLEKVQVKDFLLGQYDGYRNDINIKRNSNTETFAALKLEINNDKWKGVPFYIKAGKNLDEKYTSIYINFKKVDCLLETCPRDTNRFIIRVEPNEGFALELNSKIQGKNFEVAPVKMDFSHKNLYGPNTPEAYENLLENVIKGDQSLFVRDDEIENAWKVIDKIEKNKVYFYKKGSKGPSELEEWGVKYKMRWCG